MNRPRALVELRLRTRVSDEELETKIGRILTEDDFNITPTGDCKILKPNGQVLAVYRKGIIPEDLAETVYPVLHDLKDHKTTNRGLASGTPRLKGQGTRSYAMNVPSALLGGFEAQGPRKFCRLTAWTGQEMEKYKELWPLFEFIGGRMLADSPDRYAAQMQEVARTHPDWVIPGTPFSTITVNNTYPTGVHQDAGDLDSGISTLAVFRRGSFRGGVLVFPEYRVGIDMQHRDLLLMDAHSFHGNTDFDPPVKRTMTGKIEGPAPDFERISVVSYFRTKIVECSSATDESEKRRLLAENRAAAAVGE